MAEADDNLEVSVRLKGDGSGLVGETRQGAEAMKSLEKQARKTGEALADEGRQARTAADDQRRYVEEVRRRIEAEREARDVRLAAARDTSALGQTVDAYRTAQAALNAENDRAVAGMKALGAETLAVTAAKSGLRSAISALMGAFSGPAGIISLLASAALAWTSFGTAAEDGAAKAQAAAEKSRQQVVDIVAAANAAQGASIAAAGATISRLQEELARAPNEAQAAQIQSQIAAQQYTQQALAAQIVARTPAGPRELVAFEDATKGLRPPSAVTEAYQKQVALLNKYYAEQIGLVKQLSLAEGERELRVMELKEQQDEYLKSAERSYQAQMKAFQEKAPKERRADHAPDSGIATAIRQAQDMLTVSEAQLVATEKLTPAELALAKAVRDHGAEAREFGSIEERVLFSLLDKAAAAQREAHAREASAKSLENYNKANAQFLGRQHQEIAQLERVVAKQDEHNEQIGLTAEALARLRIRRAEEALALEQQRAALSNIVEASSGEYELALKRVELRERELQQARDASTRGVEAAQAKEAMAEGKRIADNLERSLTDSAVRGLIEGFRRGESIVDNFLERLKESFAAAVLTPIIQPIMRPIANFVSGAVQGIGQSIFGDGGLRGIGDALSLGRGLGFDGGGMLGGLFGNGLTGVGSGAVIEGLGGVFGTQAALGELGLNTALGSAAGIGTALPWIGGALAVGSMLGLFDDGGGPKPSQLGVMRNEAGQFWVSQIDVPGGAANIDAYNATIPWGDLNDPKKYDPTILAGLTGYLQGGPGESAESMVARLTQLIEPARAAAAEALRLEQERAKVIAAQVDDSLRLADAVARFRSQVDELILSNVSPLTAKERLDYARESYSKTLDLAGSGDADALGRYNASLQAYYREAAGYYGTSTPTYRAIFEGGLADREGLVDDLNARVIDQLGDSAEEFAAMNLSLDLINASLKDLPEGIGEAFKAAAEKQTRAIIDALVQQGIDIRNGVQGALEAAERA